VDKHSELLARGPWDPSSITARWHRDPFEPDADSAAQADRVLDELKLRGSPAHDGMAARLISYEQTESGLVLELQPIRWSLRLGDAAAGSLSGHCVVRDPHGRWLAGRRAQWVASWAGRWALGAAGAVEVDENPVQTLARELEEEWSVTPERLQVEAMIRLPSGMVMFVGQAWLGEGAVVTPDAEHDEFAWWPADLSQWPSEGDEPLLSVAALLAGEAGAS
jgi:ADP-ribose pyrophosphatase YjhB (NUDIX family)